jgi:Family of unknown function (DUF6694)
MTMKRSILTTLCCLLLAACVFDPTFDTSSWEAFQRSSSAIRARLSNEDLRRLEITLNYMLMEGSPKIDSPMLNNAIAKEGFANPQTILARLAPKLNGKSAAAVIKNLSIKLDTEISDLESRMQNAEGVLAAVEVASPTYYWRRSGYITQPVIEFSVYNAGKFAISRVYLSGILSTPNRSIPWVRQSFVLNFKGGLEPRERRRMKFEPRYGEWNDKQLSDLSNPELKLTVTNFDDASGERMIAIDGNSLEVRRRVRSLL